MNMRAPQAYIGANSLADRPRDCSDQDAAGEDEAGRPDAGDDNDDDQHQGLDRACLIERHHQTAVLANARQCTATKRTNAIGHRSIVPSNLGRPTPQGAQF